MPWMWLSVCEGVRMIRIQPPKPRYTVEDNFAALRVVIPARRSWALILFLGFWLTGWAAGEFFVGAMLIRGAIGLITGDPQAAGDTGGAIGGTFMAVWLLLWTVGGGFALITWLWNVAGKEIVSVDSDALTIQKTVFGIGLSKRYATAYVDRLRATGEQGDTQGPWSGGLGFDYGGGAVQFGAGLSQAEAKEVLERIADRFPSLTRGLDG